MVFVAVTLAPSPAHACSCKKPLPDFWQVAASARVVVVAEVTRRIRLSPKMLETGFEIRVIETVKGQESRQTIELVNRSPSMCSIWPFALEIGQRYAFALNPGDPDEGAFSICWPRIHRLPVGRDGLRVGEQELKQRLSGEGAR